MNRRDFIKTTTGFGLASMLGTLPTFAHENRIKNCGVQLYTVRDLLKVNMPKTIAQVAEIGFKEVECTINIGAGAKQFKHALDQNGLTCVARHFDPAHLKAEQLKKHLEEADIIGHKYLVMAWIPPNERRSLDDYKAHIETFNTAGEMCKDAGIQFAYHHHEFEFDALEGVVPFDLMLSEISDDLMKIEMDFYWMAYAKKDPLAMYDRYPGRFHMCHIKDMDENMKFADAGQGTIDFERNLSKIKHAGFKHFFIEHDEPVDSLATIRTGFEAMKNFKIS